MNKDRSMELASQETRFDALDRRLISELRVDPRLAYATLGGRLGVTGMTAANRLQRLRQSDLVRFSVAPNFAAQGLATRVLGLLQADVSALEECLRVIAGAPFVVTADRVSGEYDLAFSACLPSEQAMGGMVRDLHSVPGVRRLVVHHVLDTVKDEDGGSAVWAEPEAAEDTTFEIAPGVRVPDHLRQKVVLAAHWLNAFVGGDVETLGELSRRDVTFTIMPPQLGAGTFAGFPAVAKECQLAGSLYRHLWHRIIAVTEAEPPYAVAIDAFNTAERRKGQIRTAFARMAFGFHGDCVQRVVSLGQLELPDLPEPTADELAATH
ncbi:MAG: Lrp/AsnC family transcriptional regulator [Tepidiformaceae bacterium]